MEETLKLHKLGLSEIFGVSLGTNNYLESLNSQLGRYLNKLSIGGIHNRYSGGLHAV